MLQAINLYLKSYYLAWLDKRIPASQSIVLNRRRIFIFLSSAGYGFCLLLILMFVVAVNYQNNMVFAAVFLLSSLFVISLFQAYLNMSGLMLSYQRADNAFVGDTVVVELLFTALQQQTYYSIRCLWQDSELELNLAKAEQQTLRFHLKADSRGCLKAPRLLLESYYPLGLYRTWSWLALDVKALVYPLPLECTLRLPSVTANGDEGALSHEPGADDFYGFKSYQPGHSLKQVHWPAYAKGQALLSKEFTAQNERVYCLDWQCFEGDVEQRLSALCYWVLEFSRQEHSYSMILPNATYGPSSGEQFNNTLLAALALYPSNEGGKQ